VARGAHASNVLCWILPNIKNTQSPDDCRYGTDAVDSTLEACAPHNANGEHAR
jgi:hypothetical protein